MKKNQMRLQAGDEIQLELGGACRLTGAVGLVVLSDGTCLSPLAQPGVQSRNEQDETACGLVDRLIISNAGQDGLRVSVTCNLYCDQPVAELEMSVTNETRRDVVLDRLVLFRGTPPTSGFGRDFPDLQTCRFLQQPHFWPGHFDVRNYLAAVPPNGKATAHWDTVIGTDGKTALAIGIGEAARAHTEIEFSANAERIGLEISHKLRVDTKEKQMLRLAAGATFVSHRMVLLLGANPRAALDDYAQFVCKRLNWQLRFPAFAGLFTAYGNDPENRHPEKNSLGEKRLAELMQVVEKELRPYGLDTIKTQFHGFSSSKPDGTPIRKLSAAEAKNPAKVRQLVEAIHEKAFAPDDYDNRLDFPHGLGWHVRELSKKGYRPALVCRPFYNIEAGTPELDQAAADLFEMAVKKWGYRYLMFDFIFDDYLSCTDTLTNEQGIFNRFQAVRDRVGPDIFIEACIVPHGPVLGVADGYRPAHDWRGGLEEDLAPTFACRYHFHNRFFQCDNEFFDPAVRPFTWENSGMENMLSTLARARLWVSYNAMLGYSYLGGGALERVEPERWWTFQRALPPQPGRAEAVDFFQHSPPQRWLRHCVTPAGKHDVIGLFNWSKTEPMDEPVRPAAWDLPADVAYLFFDFWAGEVYGPARQLPGWLAPFSCRMLQVQPVPSQPALVGNSRHVTGQVGIEQWQWSPESGELRGTFSGAPNSEERYWIWLPGNEGVVACKGACFEVLRPRLVRLTIRFDATGRQDWSLQLNAKVPVP